MISQLRKPKRLIVGLFIVNIVIIIFILAYLERIPTDKIIPSSVTVSITDSIKSLTDKFDYSYLYASDANTTSLETLLIDETGYQLLPQNVKFKFLNSNNMKGSPEEILEMNKETYSRVVMQKIDEPQDINLETLRPPKPDDLDDYKHANATIIALVRNSEITKIARTIKRYELSFNSKFRYPYTFINDEPFSEKFKKRMQELSSAKMNFVVIPEDLWKRPSFIDTEKQDRLMEIMASHDVSYAKMLSYHNMCRFYSGNFYNVPELQQYKYYWRIEPDVEFYTDLQYDVFKYMELKKKVYGFTINLYDIDETVATLWPETLDYLNTGDNYKYVNPNGAFQWLLNDLQNPKKNQVANGYSTCHFWSNFEIADMDFFRGEAYNNWFKYLDSTGKFYYERWGDAPVHSMGVALFANKEDVHWFRDIGYFHDPYLNCPNSDKTSRCNTGEFSRWEHLHDQNCMATWIDHEMNENDGKY